VKIHWTDSWSVIKNLIFDKNGKLAPKKIKYKIKHDEETEDYIDNECNFRIEFDRKGETIFKKKEKKND